MFFGYSSRVKATFAIMWSISPFDAVQFTRSKRAGSRGIVDVDLGGGEAQIPGSR